MQLYISKSGFKDPVKHIFNDVENSLSRAKATSLNPPSSFRYASYVRNLDSEVNKYIRENASIESDVINAEKTYELEWNSAKNKIALIEEIKVEERIGFGR